MLAVLWRWRHSQAGAGGARRQVRAALAGRSSSITTQPSSCSRCGATEWTTTELRPRARAGALPHD
eukprot:6390620-Prymnesium_polylepis.3